MGKVADGRNFNHARAPFKGVQVPQQVFDFQMVLRVGLPTHQGRTRAFENVESLIQKDVLQLRVAIALGRVGLNAVRRPLAGTQLRRGGAQLGNLQGFGALPTDQARGFRCQTFMQQVVQGLDQHRLRGDFLPRRQLVEHVDQCFMGVIGLGEKTLTDRQTAFFNGAIQIKQGFAQRVERLQVQQMRGLGQAGQMLEQPIQPLTLVRVLAPVQ